MQRRKMLEEFVAQNPTDPFARYGLALELVNSGDTENALREFERLLEMNPEYTAGYQMYGQTLIQTGESERAIPVLQKGIETARQSGNTKAVSEMQGLLDEIQP
jgi:predicted Zn-dependent protease